VRIVTTGHDDAGQPMIVADGPVQTNPFPATGEVARIFSSDSALTYPNDGADPSAKSFFPPVGGVRVALVRLFPETDTAEVGGSIDEVGDDLARALDDPDAGMHVTNTTDVVYIVSGSVELEVGASRTRLSTGDLLIQHGTKHRWTNDTAEPADLLLFLLGARRV
jgi:mannose-6-phosphate isomerase-like protein (cupin superfamily)